MDANHDQVVGKLVFELFQLRQDMHAVDAAIRPEVEQDEFAFEVLFRQWPGIEPGDCVGKLGHLEPPWKWIGQINGRSRVVGPGSSALVRFVRGAASDDVIASRRLISGRWFALSNIKGAGGR